MTHGFVHQIDPVLGELAGVYFWWYGLCYAVGFLAIHLFCRRMRPRLGLSLDGVYSLSIYFALGVLVGGRAVEVLFYERPFYQKNLGLIPALWLGGMSTHGVLLGATLSTWVFCRLHRKSFLHIADALAIPGAFLMAVGRLGNFIDGQIVGRITDVSWAVQFPDAEGFRHPVVLYDGLKNLLLVAWLLYVRQRSPVPGMVVAHFVFWYGFLRIFVDLFREYPTTLLGLATGQSFNLLMSVLGAALLIWLPRRHRTRQEETSPGVAGVVSPARPRRLWVRQTFFAAIVVFSLTLPSDSTQDIPARYGKRHPGLRYSLFYPRIDRHAPTQSLPDTAPERPSSGRRE